MTKINTNSGRTSGDLYANLVHTAGKVYEVAVGCYVTQGELYEVKITNLQPF